MNFLVTHLLRYEYFGGDSYSFYYFGGEGGDPFLLLIFFSFDFGDVYGVNAT